MMNVTSIERHITLDRTMYGSDQSASLEFKGFKEMISGINVPIIKTDSSGIDWVRIGFEIIQTDSNNGGSVNLKNLQILYNYSPNLSSESFTSYLREFVAVSNQAQEQSSTQTYIPLVTTSSTGGK